MTISNLPVWALCPICRIRSGLRIVLKSTGERDHFECDNCGHEWSAAKTPAS